MTSPIGAKPFEDINMPPISLFDDNDLLDDDGDEDEFEAFLRARKGEKTQTAPAETEVPSPKYELNEYNSILPTVSTSTDTSVPIITSSLEDRYAQVFGGKVVVPDGSLRARDIVIGSVIATPKAKLTEEQKLKKANKFKIMWWQAQTCALHRNRALRLDLVAHFAVVTAKLRLAVSLRASRDQTKTALHSGCCFVAASKEP